MMLRPRSLRASLTLWHMSALLIVLLAYAVVVFAFVRRNLSTSLDERLGDDLEWAAAMADVNTDGTLRWFDEDPDGDHASPWLQVWSNGQLIFRTAVAERNLIPEAEKLVHQPDHRVVAVHTPHATARVLTASTSIYGRPVVLQVARSETQMQGELGELMLLLLLGLPVGVAASGIGGYFVARRALGPVDRMTRQAQTITAARLSDRLPVENARDELGRLASVFNGMLGRLESSFGQMRRFAGDVSHALRTPLTAMRMVGEVTLRGPSDKEAYKAALGSMLEEVDGLTTVVERLLTMARAEAGQLTLSPEAVDLSDLAEDVAGELRVLAEEKRQTLTVVAHGRPRGSADPLILRQSVVNLVDNAIKYTPEGGEVKLELWDDPSAAVVEVTDTGPGIPTNAQRHIFNRFYRGAAVEHAPASAGSGLGLSIAKWAVEANGGKLKMKSTTGGTTFRITLPRAAALCLALVGLLWSAPSFGHHALSEYDDTQVTTIEGTLSEIRIKNPHSTLMIDARGVAGRDRWTVEWLAALVLRKEGVENSTLQPGDRLIITGNPSRDHTSRRLWLRTVTRPADGWTWAGKF
jgi:heavy metal sensor kinase